MTGIIGINKYVTSHAWNILMDGPERSILNLGIFSIVLIFPAHLIPNLIRNFAMLYL